MGKREIIRTAPDRIWAYAVAPSKASGHYCTKLFSDNGIEYVRSDLAEADAERSEAHRNDLYDTVVSQRTSIAALEARCAELAKERDEARRDHARSASTFLSRGGIIAQDAARINELEAELATIRGALEDKHSAEKGKLGQMLLDKSDHGREKANWQGGRVNGLASALDIARAKSALASRGAS